MISPVVKILLSLYILLLVLILTLFVLFFSEQIPILVAIILFPVNIYALFSCAYDLLEYREELIRLQDYLAKHTARLIKRYQRWRDEKLR